MIRKPLERILNRAPRLKRFARSAPHRLKRYGVYLAGGARIARYLAGFSRAPDYLYLEFVNICNADCIFCAYQIDQRPKATLSLEHVRRVMDEYEEIGGKNIGLTPLLGELFIDREALTKIKYVENKLFVHVHAYTNASLLHKVGIENLLKSGVTDLRISVPPFDEATYKAIYRNSNYERVRDNVRNLLKAFSELSDTTVKTINIEFRADRSLKECQSLPDFVEYIQPYLSERVQVVAITHYDTWGGAITAPDLLAGMTVFDHRSLGLKRSPCARMFDLQVLADGKIRQCGARIDARAKEDEMELGHISTMTLQEAWLSRKAKKNVWSFVSGNHLDLCKNCSIYEPIAGEWRARFRLSSILHTLADCVGVSAIGRRAASLALTLRLGRKPRLGGRGRELTS